LQQKSKIMEELLLKSTVKVAQMSELTDAERSLVEQAIEATNRSYAPYSNFSVGAAILLKNGTTIMGCNQENAAFPSGICAERSAIFAAGAQYPDQPVIMLAIAARNEKGELQEEPVSPCGPCRQVIIETETRYKQPVRILLYGKKYIYVVDGIRQLMPLSFTEF
jgi:cytidine deaminase